MPIDGAAQEPGQHALGRFRRDYDDQRHEHTAPVRLLARIEACGPAVPPIARQPPEGGPLSRATLRLRIVCV
jgi:hypothetical protein